MNRREFAKSLLGTIASYSLLETLFTRDAFAGAVKPVTDHWVRVLTGRSSSPASTAFRREWPSIARFSECGGTARSSPTGTHRVHDRRGRPRRQPLLDLGREEQRPLAARDN